MVDAEISILITAVDKMSATLKNIDGNLNKFSKNSTKQTEALTKSFQSQTDSLIALGNIAGGVDRIFSSYQNLQLRLENASERVINAQERLADTQTRLNRLVKSGTASSEDLADAQKDVERASRGVTIAQNNQARAQNAVIGTYINMGVQSLTLIKSTQALIAANGGLAVSIKAITRASLAFMATPLGIALIALAAVVGALTYQKNQLKKADEELVTAQAEVKSASDSVTDSFGRQQRAIQGTYDTLMGLTQEKGTPELKVDVDIAKQQEIIAKLKAGQNVEGAKGLFFEEAKLKNLQSQSAVFETQRASQAAQFALFKAEDLEKNKIMTTTEDNLKARINQTGDLRLIWNEQVKKSNQLLWDQEFINLQTALDKYASAQAAKSKLLGGGGVSSKGGGTSKMPTAVLSAQGRLPAKKKDFLMRPGQQAVNFSPDDTIIGVKNPNKLGGGGNVIVYIDSVYGMKAEEISKALKRELSTKMVL